MQPTVMAYPADLKHLSTIYLPWECPPLSMNDSSPASRGAVWGVAAKKKDIQQAVHLLARNVRMPKEAGYLLVQMHYRPRDNRARDTDNLAATLKPVCDALSRGSKKIPGLGLVEDDTPRFMGKPEAIIWPAEKGKRGQLWVDLWVAEKAPYPYGLRS
ncbi:hypothetical protein CFL01nite_12430 [Corynebacterium flavescens]|uniref:Uncharacterized protein n=3 Tax=Corynebacterium flavescens TaxID=28028 RepID=A0A1L7CNJ6_CORFL|nr:hypothetical protein CFLV_09580 [Corynebacterium flavescens]KAA8720488.1 hypothetical protein F4V60_09320 [Corynebacterium flavescens]GEB97748.1 hypothetical protein CFL01nite_12430 [Corynebacterium flavescens]